MLKAIIIDDEEKAQKNLFNLLKEYCDNVEVMAMESSIEEGIERIDKLKPDLVFLDIEMDNETGFDLLKHYPEPAFHVIFVTAHDEYAIRAFKHSAVDYLLKPVDIDELTEAVTRLESKVNVKPAESNIDFLLSQLANPSKELDKLILPSMESLLFVNVEDIVRCESIDNYTNFHMASGKVHLVSKNIKHYEDILQDTHFFRVHRSHLININFIKEYHRGEGGYLTLTNGEQVPVSRRKKIAFLNQFTRQ